jgi:DNA helicase-4
MRGVNMTEIEATKFLEYAKEYPDSWKELEGVSFTGTFKGQCGIITSVDTQEKKIYVSYINDKKEKLEYIALDSYKFVSLMLKEDFYKKVFAKSEEDERKLNLINAENEKKQNKIREDDERRLNKIRDVISWSKNKFSLSLNDEQAAAVIEADSHIQVVARAGSGKTTTLITRALYLHEQHSVKPSEMLLLAFNNKAAREMQERLEKHMNADMPHVMTFHALAYALVKPQNSILFDDIENSGQDKSLALQEVLDNYLRNPKYLPVIKELMLAHFRQDWAKIEAECRFFTKEEFLRLRRITPNISLKGERLKSYGEKLIADFLFEHNIAYKYERNYRWNNKNYKPAFSLLTTPDSGVVIEYFGNPSEDKYDKMEEEKREFWQSNGKWKFIEIESDIIEKGRDCLNNCLRDTLQKYGIVGQPLSEDEIWDRIKERAIDRFTESAVNFIQRCRKSSLTGDDLQKRIITHKSIMPVEEKYLKVMGFLYSAYLKRTEDTGQDDFDGLMQKAVLAVSSGKTIFERKSRKGDLREMLHIFIDEYQDFSELFHNLVTAIRKHNTKAEFFCVGDDWQAINGFAGSDLQYYNDFGIHFNPSRELQLSTNYRSCDSIVYIGNTVMEGFGAPAVAFRKKEGSVLIVDTDGFSPNAIENETYAGDRITPIVLRIAHKELSAGREVVILSRKNDIPWCVNYPDEKHYKSYSLPNYLNYLKDNLPSQCHERISISTAHKYKGLEKDVVILIDAIDRSYPLIHPDWVFCRILGASPGKIIDEERRLFYVALTRAKDSLYIITENKKRTPFLSEKLMMSLTERGCIRLDGTASLLHNVSLMSNNWQDYPSPTTERSSGKLIIKIKDNKSYGDDGGTFPILPELKRDNYSWDKNNKTWQKSFQKTDFNVDKLKATAWGKKANMVKVEIYSDNEVLSNVYTVNKGIWKLIDHENTVSLLERYVKRQKEELQREKESKLQGL